MAKLLGFGPLPAPDRNELAHEALQRGQAILASGDGANAMRWLDRACRLLPADPTLKLALAAACVGRDDARAASLFALLAEQYGSREVWLGLAGTRRAIGDISGAAAALGRGLSAYVVDPALTGLADAIGRESGAAGWCCLTRTGTLLLHLADHGGLAELSLDDETGSRRVACGEHELPERGVPGRRISVLVCNRHVIGSPLDTAAIGRIDGFVQQSDGGVTGWAWQPGDPDRDPVLTISDESGTAVRITASDLDRVQTGLARARGFSVSSSALGGLRGHLHVRGADARDLLGSPLDPRAEQRASVAAAEALARRFSATGMRASRAAGAPVLAIPADIVGPRPKSRPRRREADIVIPVHGASAESLACLDSVLATIAPSNRVIVVDDASPERDLAVWLDKLVRQRRIRLIRHTMTLGFPGAANAGLRAAGRRDAVLLNSDTLVPPFWLERLREAAYSADDVGTATPLTNSGSIVSYPGPADANPGPDLGETARLAKLAHHANAGVVVELPVAVGFCMYIRRDCLDAVGLFRTDAFSQGYGEENDFCLRARHLGWRHVAAAGVFVAHLGGRSFGPAGLALQRRNQLVLNRLHPGYDGLIADWAASDPLAEPRRRLDVARWRDVRRRGNGAAILITHDQGGGVERCINESCRNHAAAGRRPIVLRPAADEGTPGAVAVSDGTRREFPNLKYALPGDMPALLRLLRSERPVLIELHHLLGHPPAILDIVARLGVPYQVHVHDHAWFCPRVILIGPDRRYCGEPDVAWCETCVADAGSAFEEPISVAEMRRRSAGLLAGAGQILAPSNDTATRLRRHFPGVMPRVVPHEDDRCSPSLLPSAGNRRYRVCVVGAIGVAKGFDVLLGCARDAAARTLPLEFVVVGHTIDDRQLMATDRVFVTGEFRPGEAEKLIGLQRADLAFLPSIWPETWCFTLTEAWRAGLFVAAFDIGTQAERIRRTGCGFLLPLGLSAAAINNAMLAASSQSVHESARFSQPSSAG